ncbi:ubiquinone biosynthesis monooxygenase COQ6, mitochondrial [Athalia rosae]|uniref:ubiquinone biosynthesis monooxygenase COQ6, mitochondrial n=1 Tax=Athalia rosae TaxID=37344 RepID=UPI0006260F6D|nr:ubiquinone biosynthesis monooxygenase COQ6, mitochondrial [Athalia rosae]XP_020711443.1 ubiquinone biosynthesis monooxygenase COQ6, mitochondrial [Athalia rosae]XP_020711444.1 ubiquinone biosynthesis monooxygenase COQ6, mitochondrial [Athalia rosae]XP_048507963.1 ubiquinone biosynthesis monooxygenase COQ6, mitochondrial [Athalia rosae]XP_048507964.1 ubiquinone biosynthesis monooxygenase COQ6, mitochondrial [Athalia rosae]XP_048507965.1 ubiquinone biosynthesis monooxygenase COQ6, mitochondri
MAGLWVLSATSRVSVLTSSPYKYRAIVSSLYSISNNDYSTSSDPKKHYDIVIAGGGMVGTTLACAIANNRVLEEKRVLLLESGNKQNYHVQNKYSNRVVALNRQTRTLLSSIGAWQHVEAVRYAPVKKMQVWDACSDAMITFGEDHLAEELAFIVENDLLLYAINQQLSGKESVDLVYGAKVADVLIPSKHCQNSRITLQDGQSIETKLLIGADGVNSLVRKKMGVQYVGWNYEQMGVVATVQLSEPTENIVAWQRFLPGGPVALLPLTDTLSSLVWSVSTVQAKKLLSLSDEEFVDELNEALWKMYPKDGMVEAGMRALGQLLEGLSLHSGVTRQLQPSIGGIVEGTRAAFPLGFGHAASYVGPGVALVGDAAHRVHPLAGQGVNLGFGDVTALVKLMTEASRNGAVLGDMAYLSRYETLRQRHNVPTMLAIDALHRLYKGTAAPIVLARSLGLQLTNALPPLKKAIMQHASDRAL